MTMNNDILAHLEQLKEERVAIDTEYNIKEQALRDKAIALFINTLKEYGLDELLLLPLNSDGEMPDEWGGDECDSSKLVDCSIELLYAGEKTQTEYGVERPIITRFGIKDDHLIYHTTIFSTLRDGDLSLSNIRMENWQTDWLPISEYKDNKKLIELLFTFMGHSGNWEFSKQHPECRMRLCRN